MPYRPQPWRDAPRCRRRWLLSRVLLLLAVVALWAVLRTL